jgi:hypothetical protein
MKDNAKALINTEALGKLCVLLNRLKGEMKEYKNPDNEILPSVLYLIRDMWEEGNICELELTFLYSYLMSSQYPSIEGRNPMFKPCKNYYKSIKYIDKLIFDIEVLDCLEYLHEKYMKGEEPGLCNLLNGVPGIRGEVTKYVKDTIKEATDKQCSAYLFSPYNKEKRSKFLKKWMKDIVIRRCLKPYTIYLYD